jgi:hypothetical protein
MMPAPRAEGWAVMVTVCALAGLPEPPGLLPRKPGRHPPPR